MADDAGTRNRRIVAVTLMATLAVGLLTAPADAKRRRKRPRPKPPVVVSVPLTFWLRNQTEGCEPEDLRMTLLDGPDTSNCGESTAGLGNTLLMATGRIPVGITYRAVEGLPFVLDGAAPVHGTIQVKSLCCEMFNISGSAGDSTIVIDITGTTNGETKMLGTAKHTYNVVPGTFTYKVDFSFVPDPVLHGLEFTELYIKMYNYGSAPAHGFYSTDDPASFFTLNALQTS